MTDICWQEALLLILLILFQPGESFVMFLLLALGQIYCVFGPIIWLFGLWSSLKPATQMRIFHFI